MSCIAYFSRKRPGKRKKAPAGLRAAKLARAKSARVKATTVDNEDNNNNNEEDVEPSDDEEEPSENDEEEPAKKKQKKSAKKARPSRDS